MFRNMVANGRSHATKSKNTAHERWHGAGEGGKWRATVAGAWAYAAEAAEYLTFLEFGVMLSGVAGA